MKDFSELDERAIMAQPNEIAMLVTPEVVKARKGKNKIDVAAA